MSSTGLKQNHNDVGYYISLAALTGKIFGYTSVPAGNTGLLAGTFSTAAWAALPSGNSFSTISTSGAILKDLGKTVVSSNRTFRKVQLVAPATLPGSGAVYAPGPASTFGVVGRQVGFGEDYCTGYIELGFEGNGVPAPVAHFGR
jgi:hypothetical protein